MNIAMIPARGGSKRIPKKNIKLFHGKPIIAYSIEAARACPSIDRVIVSTDDAEIADIAHQYGAEVPFIRPAELSDDHATTIDVIAHALKWGLSQGRVNALCCLYATAPFVTDDDLEKAHSMFEREDLAYVFSAAEFPYPVQRGFTLDNGRVKMTHPEHLLTRSQDLETSYHDAGQFYWCRTDAVEQRLPIFAQHSAAFILSRDRVQDIDTTADWEFAEKLFLLNHKQGKRE